MRTPPLLFIALQTSQTVLPLRKFYTEHMFVLARMELCNYSDTQLVKRFKRYEIHVIYCIYIYMKFGMSQMHEIDISLRKWSGGIAQLRDSEGTLVTDQSQGQLVLCILGSFMLTRVSGQFIVRLKFFSNVHTLEFKSNPLCQWFSTLFVPRLIKTTAITQHLHLNLE